MTDPQLSLIETAPRRPVLRYHGGKFRIASWVVSHFPEHRTYVEPFGGAASVLLRKPRAHAEVYNDLDSDVVNVFRVLRDPCSAARLEQLLRLTPFAREEFEASYEVAPDPVENARRMIVRSFMGWSSASVTKGHKTGFRGNATSSRVPTAVDWTSYPECIPAFIARLRGVSIENRNAVDVVRAYDSPETLFYVDPPYPLSTRHEGARWQGHGCYRHEMGDADHRFLADVLGSVRGMVVLSTYESQLYRQLYRGWRVERKRALASVAGGNGETAARMEVLYLSPNICSTGAREA